MCDVSTSVMRRRCDDHAPGVHFGGVLSVRPVIAAHQVDDVSSSIQHRGVHCGAHILLRHHVSVRAGRQYRVEQDQNLDYDQDGWNRAWCPAQGRHVVLSVFVASKLSGKKEKVLQTRTTCCPPEDMPVFVSFCPKTVLMSFLSSKGYLCLSMSSICPLYVS